LDDRTVILRIRKVLIIVAAVLAVILIGYLVYILMRNKNSKDIYDDAFADYVMIDYGALGYGNVNGANSSGNGISSNNSTIISLPIGENSSVGSDDSQDEVSDSEDNTVSFADIPDINWEICPISIDFTALKSMYPEIIGWIYCPYTAINYPVMQRDDNDFYLKHAYNGANSENGAIFADCRNNSGFSDYNVIVYGHHMIDGSMFAGLSRWCNQAYMDQFPYMWLLTPEGKYRVELFSAYTTSDDSGTYTRYASSGDELMGYVSICSSLSTVKCNVELDAESHYIVLSTCAYVYKDARSVVHGKLVPWN